MSVSQIKERALLLRSPDKRLGSHRRHTQVLQAAQHLRSTLFADAPYKSVPTDFCVPTDIASKFFKWLTT